MVELKTGNLSEEKTGNLSEEETSQRHGGIDLSEEETCFERVEDAGFIDHCTFYIEVLNQKPYQIALNHIKPYQT